MVLSDLLTPWLLLGVVLVPIIYAEKWIHSHLYGVGWLLTNEKQSATILYYVILFPGVFIHEFIQWLVAGALNVRTKRLTAWPQAQNDGTLRLDFVQIQDAGWLASAIIGAAPLLVGTILIWLISNRVLNLEAFLSALGSGDIRVIGPALRDLASTPDFYLWLYLMFAISNAMIPTPADRRGWPLLIGIFAVIVVFLVVIGVGDVLLETFTGPVAHGLDLLTAAFTAVLTVEVVSILFIGFLEEILERATKRKFIYSQPAAVASVTREPGSSLPLPPGVPLPSIYLLELPLPDLAQMPALLARAQRRAAAPAPGTPGLRSPQPAAEAAVGEEAAAPSPAADRAPAGFQRPPIPGLRSPGLSPRDAGADADDEAPDFRRPAAPDRAPGGFQRPPTPGPRSPGPSPRDAQDEAPGFRRPAGGLSEGWRATPPARPSVDDLDNELDIDLGDEEEDEAPADDEEQDDDGEVEYVDFDDL